MAGDKSIRMEEVQSGGGGGEFTDAQLLEAERLMAEVPRIDAALKTFLALKIAEVQIAGLKVGSMAGSSSSSSSSPDAPATAVTLQGCARVLMRTLNAFDPPTSLEWGHRNPQTEVEGGLEFMHRLSQYKVVRALWAQCRTKGQKPAQLLGFTALQTMFPQLKSLILDDARASAQAARATEDQLHQFIEGFGATLIMPEDAVGGEMEESGKREEVQKLVWAKDYKAALARRQSARKEEAAERVERAVSAESFAEEMRSALAGDGGGGGSSSVQIEEVDG